MKETICAATEEVMLPMSDHINNLKKKIDDLEWEGNYDRADRVKQELACAEKKYLSGEMYEPDF